MKPNFANDSERVDFYDRQRILGCMPCREGDHDKHQVDFAVHGIVLLCRCLHQLERGKRYWVRYRIPGVHRYDRASIMDFLWVGTSGADEGKLMFNARPEAGTQAIEPSWVKGWREVDKSTKIKLNMRAE